MDEINFFFEQLRRDNIEDQVLKEYLVSDITDMAFKNIFWKAKPLEEDDGEFETDEVEREDSEFINEDNPQMYHLKQV